ncbi:hypothetical protein N9A94_09385, partial [Akkermansiaceae bacterium]|nr:hypothetical protein [Akkermansiaceae bacterium]
PKRKASTQALASSLSDLSRAGRFFERDLEPDDDWPGLAWGSIRFLFRTVFEAKWVLEDNRLLKLAPQAPS